MPHRRRPSTHRLLLPLARRRSLPQLRAHHPRPPPHRSPPPADGPEDTRPPPPPSPPPANQPHQQAPRRPRRAHPGQAPPPPRICARLTNASKLGGTDLPVSVRSGPDTAFLLDVERCMLNVER